MAELPPFRVAIPVSAGAAAGAEQLRAFLAGHLAGRFAVEVAPIASYAAIGRELLSGRAQVGWAPPIVAARVELCGGHPLVQPVRNGSPNYRSALVCRRDRPINVASCFELRAAWVDRDSTAGYLLPRAWARGQGLDPDQAFADEQFTGSYRAALEAVLTGKADLTAVFSPAATPDLSIPALAELSPEQRAQLKIFAVTDEAPGEALCAAPAVSFEVRHLLEQALGEARLSQRKTNIATCLSNLGQARLGAGAFAAALESLEEARALAAAGALRDIHSETARALADTHLALGDPSAGVAVGDRGARGGAARGQRVARGGGPRSGDGQSARRSRSARAWAGHRGGAPGGGGGAPHPLRAANPRLGDRGAPAALPALVSDRKAAFFCASFRVRLNGEHPMRVTWLSLLGCGPAVRVPAGAGCTTTRIAGRTSPELTEALGQARSGECVVPSGSGYRGSFVVGAGVKLVGQEGATLTFTGDDKSKAALVLNGGKGSGLFGVSIDAAAAEGVDVVGGPAQLTNLWVRRAAGAALRVSCSGAECLTEASLISAPPAAVSMPGRQLLVKTDALTLPSR